jgi:tetratricopeptide (TPR) repeat protein
MIHSPEMTLQVIARRRRRGSFCSARDRLRNLVTVFLVVSLSIIHVVSPVSAEYAAGMEAYRKAWSAYSRQDFNLAQSWAQRAIQAYPEHAHAHALLGDLFYLGHDLTNAKTAWTEALRLNPMLRSIRNQLAQANMELEMERDLKAFEVGSLTVRLPKDLSSEDSQVILMSLEGAIEELAPYFQYRPSRPIVVLVYPRDAFYDSMHVSTEVLGLFDGKIRLPSAASGEVWRPDGQKAAVLWHEYAHALVYDTSNGRAPRWLHEGIAQVVEQMVFKREDSLRSILLSDPALMPSFKALIGIPDETGQPVIMDVRLFYQASHQAVQYLLEVWGWDRVRMLLSELGSGSSMEEALQNVTGWDLKKFEHKWRLWMAGH